MHKSPRIRTAVLISGNGSNLQALIDAAAAPGYPAEIAFVLSNKSDAYGLTRAAQASIETAILSHRDYSTREAFDAAMNDVLHSKNIELVCLAGFMRVLSDGFVQAWGNRLLNIHPSLLPLYKGLDTHARVLAAGDRQHGASVHQVIAELDAGEIILQKSLAILPGETAQALQQRVHQIEHEIYPQALKQVAEAMRRQ